MGGDKTYWATSSFDVVLVDLVHVYLYKLFDGGPMWGAFIA